MFSLFKKHFIPHEGNEHRPHILRKENVRNIIAIAIFIEVIVFLMPVLGRLNTSGYMAEVLPGVLSALTNHERQENNLPTLTVNPLLNEAAELKAQDMATRGYFAHTSPEGKTPWYWFDEVGYKYQYAGENLAVNFSDSEDVAEAWIESPTHKANIVKTNYTDIGTGIATGIFQGKEAVYVAQLYANPLPEPKVVTPIPTTTSPAPEEKSAPTPAPKVTQEKTQTTAPAKQTAVLGAESENVSSDNSNAPVISPSPTPVKQPTPWQAILALPRTTADVILSVIFAIMALALLVYIVVRAKNHHRDLITNGLVVLAVLGAIFLVNFYWSHSQMIVSDSYDFSIYSK